MTYLSLAFSWKTLAGLGKRRFLDRLCMAGAASLQLSKVRALQYE
jgi:hypothetical protein